MDKELTVPTDGPAENTPNDSKHFSPKCLPKPRMSAQAQKFEIFEKSSLWVSIVRCTKIAQGYRFSHAMGIMLWTFWQLKLFCILREYVFFYYLLQYIWGFLSENYYILLDDFLKFLLTCGFPLNLQNS